MTAIFQAIKGFFQRLFGTVEKDIKNELAALHARVATLESKVKVAEAKAVSAISSKVK